MFTSRLQKPAKPADTNQLDLFAEVNGDNSPAQTEQEEKFDTIENRLCQYLLNPEVAFNPYKDPG